MEFLREAGVATISLNTVATISLACFLILLGKGVKSRVKIIETLCIPGPVVGGLLFSIIIFALREYSILNVNLDISTQSVFMVAFFTTVGFDASFSLIKKGGKLLLIYWGFCIVLIFAQNIIGVLGAKLTGIHPLLGLMCGAISMGGGHGTSASFAPVIEGIGIEGAGTIGLAAATLGLMSGGLIGAPVARFLIKRHNLKAKHYDESEYTLNAKDEEGVHSEIIDSDSVLVTTSKVDASNFIKHLFIISTCMTIGYALTDTLSSMTGYVLPEYLGGMLVAMIFRNMNDKFKFVKVDYTYIELFGNVGLRLFLTMALMSIKLWELKTLGIPMMIIIGMQIIFLTLFAIFVMFRGFGKDYDAAVMIAGFIGHELGATPNALANVNSICLKYGHSQKAFFIIPIVCAFLIDLVALPTIITFINIFS